MDEPDDAQSDVSHADDCSEPASEDIQQALALIKQLRNEKHQLTSNFENLKSLHLELAASQKQLEQNYKSLQQERVQVERQYQQLCESWRIELEEKQKQFEHARSQILQPRDLDVLRVQLLEEVEAPFRIKCELIAKEAEATQAQYVKLRRDYEALQNNVNAMEAQHEGELQLQQADAAAIEQGLRERIKDAEADQARVSGLEQQLRATKRSEEEARLQLRALKEEAQELRRAKEEAVVEREQAAVRGERRAKQLQLESAQLQGLAESLTRKCRHLQGELGECNHAAEAAHSKLMALQATNLNLSNQLSDTQAAATRERQLLSEGLEAAEKEWEAKLGELHKQLLQKDQALAAAVVSERESVRQAEEEGMQALQAAMAEAAEKLSAAAATHADLTTRLRTAEVAAAEWQGKAVEWQNQARLEVAAARQEALEAAQEVAASQRLASSLQQQLGEALAQKDTLRGSLQRMELSAEPGLELRLHAEGKASVLEQRNQQLEEQVTHLGQQLQEVLSEAAANRERMERQLEEAQESWLAEQEALAQRYSEKQKKLKQAAKEQVTSLRGKVKSLKAAKAERRLEMAGLRNSLHEREAELAAISRLTERSGTTGTRSPGPWSPAATSSVLRLSTQQRPWHSSGPTAGVGGDSALVGSPGGLAAGEGAGPMRSLEAVFADVRQRQEQYLQGGAV